MRTETGAASIRVLCTRAYSAPTAAELLCDELMDHTFVCEACINGREESCSEYASLKQKIADAGGVNKGIALTM